MMKRLDLSWKTAEERYSVRFPGLIGAKAFVQIVCNGIAIPSYP